MSAYELLSSFGARVGGYLTVLEVPRTGTRRNDFPDSSHVVAFSIPYYRAGETNLAVFAASLDYHAYVREINEMFKAYFEDVYPGRYCRVFADVSPFHETRLAAACGLGLIGDHGMIIDPEYSSFIVLGEVVMELDTSELEREGFFPADGVVHECEHCGRCRSACPVGGIDDKSRCLSALTQKKGELNETEQSIIRENCAVWGCDRCVLACPHTLNPPKESNVSYFAESRLGIVTDGDILRMSDEEYARYSFSWRKRETIIRNLRLCGFTDGAGRYAIAESEENV